MILILLLQAIEASATTYSHVPTIEEAFARSSVVVHGTVSNVDSCEGSRAWTFVTLDVHEVLRGSIDGGCGGGQSALLESEGDDLLMQACDPGPVEWVWANPLAAGVGDVSDVTASPPVLVSGGCTVDDEWASSGPAQGVSTASCGTFTFRLPYGEYADGTRATIVDTPGFAVGEEVVVFLSYDSFGNHFFMPFAWMGWSAYRVFRSDAGKSAVVDGNGSTLHLRSDGVPVRGSGHPDLRYHYWRDEPILSSEAGPALNQIASAATWTGVGRAVGPWRGRMHVSVTGDEDSSCQAKLAGTVSSTSLSLVGKCNADYAGLTDITVNGTYGTGGWSGQISFSPRAMSSQSRSVNWTSTTDDDDRIIGTAVGTHSEEGFNFNYDIALDVSFVGPRPLMSFNGFRSYLQDLASIHSQSAGVGLSIENNTTTCSEVVGTVVLP